MNTVLVLTPSQHRPVSCHYPPKANIYYMSGSQCLKAFIAFVSGEEKTLRSSSVCKAVQTKGSSHTTCYETTVLSVFALWTLLINIRVHWTILWFVLEDYFFGSNSLEMHLLWNWILGMHPLCQMADTITCRLCRLSCPCSHFYPSFLSLSALAFPSALQVC